MNSLGYPKVPLELQAASNKNRVDIVKSGSLAIQRMPIETSVGIKPIGWFIYVTYAKSLCRISFLDSVIGNRIMNVKRMLACFITNLPKIKISIGIRRVIVSGSRVCAGQVNPTLV